MNFEAVALLGLAGFAAGILNAIAGGGTIFTFSALLALGMPPVAANATSAAAVVLGSVASALAYRREIVAAFRRLLPLVAVSLVCGALGAWLVLLSGDGLFGTLVPWLLLLATAMFAFSRGIARLGARLAGPATGPRPVWPAVLLQGAVAVYGGYFGAGMGVMMLATLALTENAGFHAVNAAKNLLSIVLQAMAVAVFLAAGAVDPAASLVIAVAGIAGGWSGVHLARMLPLPVVRAFVIVSGLALSAWYFLA
ncbi:sulfite exporter TauE/SafE family protein [Marinibaculum pumilum]|uniref:Probable membrane transporter protein n=1 Tax=Marinibaculum pumilum TaxID=1766165 RepID=A0ABV7L3C7_9PROT